MRATLRGDAKSTPKARRSIALPNAPDPRSGAIARERAAKSVAVEVRCNAAKRSADVFRRPFRCQDCHKTAAKAGHRRGQPTSKFPAASASTSSPSRARTPDSLHSNCNEQHLPSRLVPDEFLDSLSQERGNMTCARVQPSRRRTFLPSRTSRADNKPDIDGRNNCFE